MPATRTWVSGVGDDANPASRTAPCKTFAGAISKTAAGGEISVLDPGGFGAVTITKAITINGDGTLASVLAIGTNGIIINAGAGDTVILRNLSIIGAGGGLNGIRYIAGGNLHIENCTISGFTANGIDVNLTAPGRLLVKDTNIRVCGANGVNIIAAGGTAVASFENVRIEQCVSVGLHAGSGSRVAIRNSVLAGHAYGLVAEQTAVDVPKVSVDRCRVSHNTTYGVRSAGTVEVRLSNSVIVSNATGLSSTGGGLTIVSFGNNIVGGNTADGAPTSTQLPV